MLHNYPLGRRSDDDEDDDNDESSVVRRLGMTIAVAALSTFASKLVEWGIDELRDRYGYKPKPEPKSPPPETKPPEPKAQ